MIVTRKPAPIYRSIKASPDGMLTEKVHPKGRQ